MKRIVMGITGASGAPYARRLAQCLCRPDLELHLVISPAGRRVLVDELQIPKVTIEQLIGCKPDNVTLHPHADIGAAIASGSQLTAGMVICPCSSHTLAAIAGGLGDNLVTRAALVTLKEARRLILVTRETPLSPIEIENMARLSRAGAIIVPASPGFYHRPQAIDDLVDFVVARVLDLLALPHDLGQRWVPTDRNNAPEAPES